MTKNIVKKIKDEPIKEDKKLIISDKQQLSEIFEGAFNNSAMDNNSNDNSVKELEIGKLVLAMIKNPEFLNSTTNLSMDEVSDLSDAYYLNLIFDSDLIDEYISRYQSLKRSETQQPRNMLTILSELSGKNYNVQQDGTFSRIIGKLKGQ